MEKYGRPTPRRSTNAPQPALLKTRASSTFSSSMNGFNEPVTRKPHRSQVPNHANNEKDNQHVKTPLETPTKMDRPKTGIRRSNSAKLDRASLLRSRPASAGIHRSSKSQSAAFSSAVNPETITPPPSARSFQSENEACISQITPFQQINLAISSKTSSSSTRRTEHEILSSRSETQSDYVYDYSAGAQSQSQSQSGYLTSPYTMNVNENQQYQEDSAELEMKLKKELENLIEKISSRYEEMTRLLETSPNDVINREAYTRMHTNLINYSNLERGIHPMKDLESALANCLISLCESYIPQKSVESRLTDYSNSLHECIPTVSRIIDEMEILKNRMADLSKEKNDMNHKLKRRDDSIFKLETELAIYKETLQKKVNDRNGVSRVQMEFLKAMIQAKSLEQSHKQRESTELIVKNQKRIIESLQHEIQCNSVLSEAKSMEAEELRVHSMKFKELAMDVSNQLHETRFESSKSIRRIQMHHKDKITAQEQIEEKIRAEYHAMSLQVAQLTKQVGRIKTERDSKLAMITAESRTREKEWAQTVKELEGEISRTRQTLEGSLKKNTECELQAQCHRKEVKNLKDKLHSVMVRERKLSGDISISMKANERLEKLSNEARKAHLLEKTQFESKLRNEQAEWTKRLEDLSHLIDDKQVQLQGKQQEIESQQDKLNESDVEIKALRVKLSAVQLEVQRLREEFNESEVKKERMEENVSSQLCEEKEKASFANAQMKLLTDELETANLCLAERRKQREEETKLYEFQLQKKSERIDALAKENAQLKTHGDTLQCQVNTQHEKLVKYEKRASLETEEERSSTDTLLRDITDTHVHEKELLTTELNNAKECIRALEETVDNLTVSQRQTFEQLEKARMDSESQYVAKVRAFEVKIAHLEQHSRENQQSKFDSMRSPPKSARNRNGSLESARNGTFNGTQRPQSATATRPKRAVLSPRHAQANSDLRLELKRAKDRIHALENEIQELQDERTKRGSDQKALLSARKRHITDEAKKLSKHRKELQSSLSRLEADQRVSVALKQENEETKSLLRSIVNQLNFRLSLLLQLFNLFESTMKNGSLEQKNRMQYLRMLQEFCGGAYTANEWRHIQLQWENLQQDLDSTDWQLVHMKARLEELDDLPPPVPKKNKISTLLPPRRESNAPSENCDRQDLCISPFADAVAAGQSTAHVAQTLKTSTSSNSLVRVVDAAPKPTKTAVETCEMAVMTDNVDMEHETFYNALRKEMEVMKGSYESKLKDTRNDIRRLKASQIDATQRLKRKQTEENYQSQQHIIVLKERVQDLEGQIRSLERSMQQIMQAEEELMKQYRDSRDAKEKHSILIKLLELREGRHAEEMKRKLALEKARLEKLSVSCGASSVTVPGRDEYST